MHDMGGKACVVVVTRVTIVYFFSIVYDDYDYDYDDTQTELNA